jgi:hypothetical protein
MSEKTDLSQTWPNIEVLFSTYRDSHNKDNIHNEVQGLEQIPTA